MLGAGGAGGRREGWLRQLLKLISIFDSHILACSP